MNNNLESTQLKKAILVMIQEGIEELGTGCDPLKDN